MPSSTPCVSALKECHECTANFQAIIQLHMLQERRPLRSSETGLLLEAMCTHPFPLFAHSPHQVFPSRTPFTCLETSTLRCRQLPLGSSSLSPEVTESPAFDVRSVKGPSKALCSAACECALEVFTSRVSGAETGCEVMWMRAGWLDVRAWTSKALADSGPFKLMSLFISLGRKSELNIDDTSRREPTRCLS